MSALPKELARTMRMLAGFKAGYFIVLVAALLLSDALEKLRSLPEDSAPGDSRSFADHFAHYDTSYYLSLSQEGYQAGEMACAFNPLLPYLVRWFSPLVGGNLLVGGLVLANLLSVAGWWLFLETTARRFGVAAGKLALLFLLAFPGSLFFQFVYSEPLFFFLLMLLWWSLERHRYGVAAAAAFLLPLARSAGIFAVLPLGWHAVEPAGQWAREKIRLSLAALGFIPQAGGRHGSGPESTPQPPARFPVEALAWRGWLLLMPLAGWGCYLALMAWQTGNPFEGVQAQRYWGVHSMWNLIDLPKFALGLVSPTCWHDFKGSFLDREVFVLVLLLLPVIWRLGKDMIAWTLMLAWLPAMSGTFTSFTRYASCVFPMFIALGVLLGRREVSWARYGLLAVFVALHVVLVWRFVHWRWAG